MKRVIKDFNTLPPEVLASLQLKYPRGFRRKEQITFKDLKGNLQTAFPFETEDTYYLIKTTTLFRNEEVKQLEFELVEDLSDANEKEAVPQVDDLSDTLADDSEGSNDDQGFIDK